MRTVTYGQVQDLVERLPMQKLPIAYRFLTDLTREEHVLSSPQREFLTLSTTERRELLAQQAEQLIAHYEETSDERSVWEAGDFTDY
jgi:hypothetical protein